MPTTVLQAIERTRNRVQRLQYESLNQLATTVTATDTVIELAFDPRSLALGVTVSIDTEDLVVVDHSSSRSPVMARGQHGTVARAHTAGAIIDETPRYSRGRILQALRDEIDSWPPDLYRVVTTTLAAVTGLQSYDLGLADGTEIVDVLAVLWDGNDTSRQNWKPVPFRTVRDAPAALSASNGVAVVLDWTPPVATTLGVNYGAPFDTSTFVAATQLVGAGGTVGLLDSQVEVAIVGAALRLVQEAPQADMETQPARDRQEVQAGLVTQIRQDLAAEHKRRFETERQRLLRRYPYRG